MRPHRFIGNFDLTKKELVVSDRDFINQAKNVLRFRPGDKIILCDSHSNEAIAEFKQLGRFPSKLEISEVYKNQNEPEKYAILYCPVLKKENFELVAQKAVEVGIKEITPVITKRTVKFGLNYERLNKIIKEAAEQSGRGILPKLNEVINFEWAVATAKNSNDTNLFFDINERLVDTGLRRGFKSKIGVFVGPEGGWSEEEIEIAKNANFTFASLGKTTLCAETAAIAASYMTCNL